MSKHTPGPWRMEHNGNDGARVNAFATVAWCPTSAAFGVDGSQVISADEAKANARLIAAAPDLLAAVERLRSDLAVFVGHEEESAVCGWCRVDTNRHLCDARSCAVARAREAIDKTATIVAKAKGNP